MAEPSSTTEPTTQPEIQEAPAQKVEETTPAATATEEVKTKQVEGETKEEKKEEKKEEVKEVKKEYVPQLKESGHLYKYKSNSRMGGYVAPLAWHHRFFKFGGQEDKCEPHKLHEYYRRNAPRKPTVPPKDDAPKEGEPAKAEAPQEGKDTESGAVDSSKYLYSTIAHARKTGEGLLFYYKNEKAHDRVYGLINLAEVDLESISTTSDVNKAHAFTFKVPKANREFFFYTETDNDCEDWVYTIKHRVQKAQSSCKSVQDSTEYKEAHTKLVAGHYFGPEAGSEPEPLSSEDDRADSPKPIPNDKRKSYFTSLQSFLKGTQTSEPELKETAEPEDAGTAPEGAAASSAAPEDKKTPPKPEKKPSLLSNIAIPSLFGGTSSEKKQEKKEGEEKVEDATAVEVKPEEKKEAEKKEAEKKEGEKKEADKKEGEKKESEEPGLFRKMTLNWRRKTDEKKPEAKAEAEAAAQSAEGAKSTETDKKPEESTTDAGAASATDAAGPAAEKTDEKPTHTQEGSSSEDKKGATSLLRRLSTFPTKRTTKPQPTPLGETQEEPKPDETVKATAAEAAEQQPTSPVQPSEAELKIKEEASKARLSGHLSKRNKYMPGVEKRYFIFTQEGSIDYYESESDRAAPKQIHVTKKCTVRKTAEKAFELDVQTRTYRFTANSADECQKWVDEITKYRDSLPEEEKDKDGDKRDREVPVVNGDQQESFESSVQAAGDRALEETEAAKAAKAAQAEAAKVEAAKVESAKVEPAKVEPAKVEPAKVEAAKVEPPTVETTVVSETTATPPTSSTVTTSSPAVVTNTDGETTTTISTTETTETNEGGSKVTTTVTSVETEVVTSSA